MWNFGVEEDPVLPALQWAGLSLFLLRDYLPRFLFLPKKPQERWKNGRLKGPESGLEMS